MSVFRKYLCHSFEGHLPYNAVSSKICYPKLIISANVLILSLCFQPGCLQAVTKEEYCVLETLPYRKTRRYLRTLRTAIKTAVIAPHDVIERWSMMSCPGCGLRQPTAAIYIRVAWLRRWLGGHSPCFENIQTPAWSCRLVSIQAALLLQVHGTVSASICC